MSAEEFGNEPYKVPDGKGQIAVRQVIALYMGIPMKKGSENLLKWKGKVSLNMTTLVTHFDDLSELLEYTLPERPDSKAIFKKMNWVHFLNWMNRSHLE